MPRQCFPRSSAIPGNAALALGAAVLLSGSAAGAQETVTFAEDVAPVIFDKCTVCHRPGEAAPFAFTDYASVKKRAGTIRRVVVNEKFMPPWHPEPGWGEFRGDRSLSATEIDLIDRWIENGAPEGDDSKTPALPAFPEGWQLGEPDIVVEMDAPFEVHAEGRDIYRYFTLPLELDADRWVRAVEVRPTARAVVHHVLFYLDASGDARKLDAADPEPGFNGKGFKRAGSLGGWAVGGSPLALSDGYAHSLPRGSDLVLQTHFHPSGKVEHEKTRIGLYFAERAPEKRLIEFQVPPGFGGSVGINIAPGEQRFEVRDHMIVPEDLDLVTAWAHAHQICTSMQAEAIFPDGTVRRLFRIGGWDFNWQGQYEYAQPLRLPKGTRIDTLITYDNTAGNPANPNLPPRRVFWGEQSTDEMGSLIFQCVAADKDRQQSLIDGLHGEAAQSHQRFEPERQLAVRIHEVLKLDADGDDRVSEAETPQDAMHLFQKLDHNRDHQVDASEIEEFGAFLDEKKG